MPHNFSMLDTQFPHFTDETTAEKLRKIQDYLFMLLEQLKYILNNLDRDNFNDAALQEIKDEIAEDIVAADIVISNTVITQNLYAEFGDIAELTVDRLLSANKVARYKNLDTSEINYLWIEGQSIKLMTGVTDGSTTQHRDRYNRLLYWKDENKLSMSAEPTAYPVIVYDYEELCKAEFSFVDVNGTYVPMIILGAGTGEGDNDKLFIQKFEDTAKIRYVTDDGRDVMLEMSEDINAGESTICFEEYDNGESGSLMEIDWTKGNHQSVTLTDDCALTFKNPSGAAMLSLRIVQDGAGGHSLTLPRVSWPGGISPAFSNGPNNCDILTLYYPGIGNTYYGQLSNNFLVV